MFQVPRGAELPIEKQRYFPGPTIRRKFHEKIPKSDRPTVE
jgi:hypothetical protein